MRRFHARPRQQVRWHGWYVDDCHDCRIGTLETIYEDDKNATAAWLLIRLARFSSRYALTPAAAVLAVGGRVWIPYTRETVESAPALYEPPESIVRSIEHQLCDHYRLATGAVPEIRAFARRAMA